MGKSSNKYDGNTGSTNRSPKLTPTKKSPKPQRKDLVKPQMKVRTPKLQSLSVKQGGGSTSTHLLPPIIITKQVQFGQQNTQHNYNPNLPIVSIKPRSPAISYSHFTPIKSCTTTTSSSIRIQSPCSNNSSPLVEKRGEEDWSPHHYSSSNSNREDKTWKSVNSPTPTLTSTSLSTHNNNNTSSNATTRAEGGGVAEGGMLRRWTMLLQSAYFSIVGSSSSTSTTY